MIGVFGSASFNTYLITNLLAQPDLLDTVSAYQIMLASDKDFMPTRVSYKLNLRGPSMNVQTACSTGLVGVCVACQNLLTYQCDMALAGSVSITFPQKHNHLFQEGGIASPDGHCRAFDAKAEGTAPGEGVGIVVLKRLSEAIADGDRIYAVIKGFGMNNDGAAKIGYTAPSELGQAEAIAWAHAMAGFDPATIGYVEAHGTGTPLGDPIEIAGLTRAFRAGTDAKNFCAIASVKTCIGHLDVAAGIAGLINAALALHHRTLPPSLNFETPNPKIDFANSPFYVNTRAQEWKAGSGPRRAGVSSFGVGGTNTHVVLEEAPATKPSSPSRCEQLLLLSAKTPTALDAATARLAEHLKRNPELNFADVAHTLQVGRHEFNHRRMLVCRDVADAIAGLESKDPQRVLTKATGQGNPSFAFLFTGQGAQRVNMGRELYESEPVFREQVDACAELLKPHLGRDIREVLFPQSAIRNPQSAIDEPAAAELKQTSLTQPALFVIEYALARLWMSWGIQPKAMIGHSIGEYVAACLAEVFSLPDALCLVATRGRLMQQLPPGAMLAMRLPETEVQPLLNDRLSLATVNSASQCVVSGDAEAIDAFQQQLAARGVAGHRLETSHAFHSPMVEPALAPFQEAFAGVTLNPPRIPFVSNVTGAWITTQQATDPAYWARHMRATVRFADGLAELMKISELALLEVGPGQTLVGLARQHSAKGNGRLIVQSLPGAQASPGELATMLNALGQLWLAGAAVDWTAFYANEPRRRVALPTYPFERKRFWAGASGASEQSRQGGIRASSNGTANGEAAKELADPAAAGLLHGSVNSSLRALFSKLSGLDLASASGTTTFLELGFDSLMLTQASQAIEKKFGQRIAFGRLIATLPNFDLLSAHLEKAVAASNGNGAESNGHGEAGASARRNGLEAATPRNVFNEEKA